MEFTTELMLAIAVMLMTGLLFGKIAKKFNVPSITGYLLGGLLIGPVIWQLFGVSGFDGLVRERMITALAIIADIELAFIAFSVGCEFKLSYFKQVGIAPLVIATAESLGAVLFITGGMLMIGCPLYFAIAMGAVGGATAPAATILVIKQYKAKGDFTKMIMSVVAIDDATALIFFGIAMAIIRSLISPVASAVWVSVMMPFAEILGSAVLGGVVGILLTVFLRYFKSSGNRLVLVIAALFINIGVCLFVKGLDLKLGGSVVHMGMSSLIACMITGGILTNTNKEVDSVLGIVEAITPPFIILFFVLSGADLKITAMTWMALLVLVTYLVFRIAGKVLGSMGSAKLMKSPKNVQKWLGFGLLPQGGIAIGLSMIIMTEFAGDVNLTAPYDGKMLRIVILCAIFISEIFGPLLCKLALIKTGEGINPKAPKKQILAEATVGADEPPQIQSNSDNE